MSGLSEAHRPVYKEVRRFRNRQAFLNWWKGNEDVGWRINSRNPNREGVVEYWKCSFKQNKCFACLASLRIVFGRNDRYVVVSRNIVHPHSHTPIRGMNTGEREDRIFQEVEPSPMQTAQIIHFPPLPPGTDGNATPARFTADSSLPTAVEIGSATLQEDDARQQGGSATLREDNARQQGGSATLREDDARQQGGSATLREDNPGRPRTREELERFILGIPE
ncbi:hypothetical protein ACQ4LE_007845 [Meloidogyne hapla]